MQTLQTQTVLFRGIGVTFQLGAGGLGVPKGTPQPKIVATEIVAAASAEETLAEIEKTSPHGSIAVVCLSDGGISDIAIRNRVS